MKKSNKILIGYGIFTISFIFVLFLLPKFLKNKIYRVSDKALTVLDLKHAESIAVDTVGYEVVYIDSLMKQKPVSLSEMVESNVVNLEWTPQSDLNDLIAYCFSPNHIYAYSETRSYIVVFTSEGKFVRRISRYNDGVKLGLIKSVVFDKINQELVVLSDNNLFYFTPEGAYKREKYIPLNVKKIVVCGSEIYAVTPHKQPRRYLQNKVGNAIIKMDASLRVKRITKIDRSNRSFYSVPLSHVCCHGEERIITSDFGYKRVYSYDMASEKAYNKYRFVSEQDDESVNDSKPYILGSFWESNALLLFCINNKKDRYRYRSSINSRKWFIKRAKEGDFIRLDVISGGGNLANTYHPVGIQGSTLIMGTRVRYRTRDKSKGHNPPLVFLTIK
ncbi:6-bladed beta-propeller [Prolixibacteraceae bacterium]|nr:6-bladed beta-propeller [Prolixibacteraceae bacterium]